MLDDSAEESQEQSGDDTIDDRFEVIFFNSSDAKPEILCCEPHTLTNLNDVCIIRPERIETIPRKRRYSGNLEDKEEPMSMQNIILKFIPETMALFKKLKKNNCQPGNDGDY